MNPISNEKFQTAIETLLQPEKLPNGILRIKQGAQFSRFGAVAGWFFTMVLLITAIVFSVQGRLLMSAPLYLMCILIIAFILDLQGMELHPSNGTIRTYKSFLGYRSGRWHPVADFTHIRIFEDKIHEGRALSSGSTYNSYRSYDTHKFYGAYLVSRNKNAYIRLFEDESVTRAKIFAAKFAEISSLDYAERIGRGETDVIGGIL